MRLLRTHKTNQPATFGIVSTNYDSCSYLFVYLIPLGVRGGQQLEELGALRLQLLACEVAPLQAGHGVGLRLDGQRAVVAPHVPARVDHSCEGKGYMPARVDHSREGKGYMPARVDQ
eukprot:5320041-Pyramimonas_sp.AAC.1